MWVKEYIKIECRNCPQTWEEVHEWGEQDDDNPHHTIKGYTTKGCCKECKQQEERERQSKKQTGGGEGERDKKQ